MRFSLVGILVGGKTLQLFSELIVLVVVLSYSISNGWGQAAGIKCKIQGRWIADLSKE